MTKKKTRTTRREFLAKTGVITAGMTLGSKSISAMSYKRINGANDRIRVGFIGVGNRGSQLLQAFMAQADCEVASLCDVYEPYITRDRSKVNPRFIKVMPRQIPQMGEIFPNKVEIYSDYRKLLDNKSIDAVLYCDTGPLACPADNSFNPGRQRCICREASVQNNPRRSNHGKCRKKQ
jgi:hypothetical protein